MGEIVKEKEENIERKGRNNGVYRTEGNHSESSPRTRTKKQRATQTINFCLAAFGCQAFDFVQGHNGTTPFILSVSITTTYCLLSLPSLYRWNRKRTVRSSTRTPEFNLITTQVLITTVTQPHTIGTW